MKGQDMKEEQVQKRVNKASLQAADAFDLERLQTESVYMLRCEVCNEKETLLFCYDTAGTQPLSALKEEDLLTRYAALADIANLHEIRERIAFSLNPENLYYDMNAKVRVMERDICTEEPEKTGEIFLCEYKAVVGAVLQNRYDYEDYIQGGMNLLNKNRFLSKVYQAETVEEIREVLCKTYYEEKQKRESEYCLVYRQKHMAQLVWGTIMTIVAVLLGVISFYLYCVRVPYMEAMLKAHQDYYDSDYVAVIDDLQQQDIYKMDVYGKCILAISYVKTENLTVEQKENIISRITVNGNEKYICFWIELGRGNISEAENIAMQISDDELLIYAYMKERSRLESDESVDGSEKAKRLEELQRMIEELAEKYSE